MCTQEIMLASLEGTHRPWVELNASIAMLHTSIFMCLFLKLILRIIKKKDQLP